MAFPRVSSIWYLVSGIRNTKYKILNTKYRKASGFTLIELLVAITILGILISIASFSLNNALDKGRDNRRKQDLAQIKSALTLYFQDNGKYPPPCSPSPCTEGVTYASDNGFDPWIPDLDSYIKKMPKDPRQTSLNIFSQLASLLPKPILEPKPAYAATAGDVFLCSGYSNCVKQNTVASFPGTPVTINLTMTSSYPLVLSSTGDVQQLVSGGWNKLNGTVNFPDTNPVDIEQKFNDESNANIYVLTTTGNIWKLNASAVPPTWTKLNSSNPFSQAISMSAKTYTGYNTIYVLKSDGLTWAFDLTTNTYTQNTINPWPGSAPQKLSQFYSNTTLLFANDANGDIYYQVGNGWAKLNGPAFPEGQARGSFGFLWSSNYYGFGLGPSGAIYLTYSSTPPTTAWTINSSTAYYTNAGGANPIDLTGYNSNFYVLDGGTGTTPPTPTPIPTPTPSATPTSAPTPPASPSSSPVPSGDCNDKDVYCYVVLADRKSYTLWAKLENTSDPEINTMPSATCTDTTPPTGFNYCLKSD